MPKLDLTRVARYRPFLVAAAGLLAVTAFPATNDDQPVTADTAAGGESVAVDDDGSSVAAGGAAGPTGLDGGAPGDAAGGTGVPGGTAAPTGGPATGAGATGQQPGQVPAGTTAPAGRYPGIGTPEALANPNCDPATGRIRFPSAYAPQCVAPWPADGDNGGATHRGVTADAIKYAVYVPADTANKTALRQQWADTFATFNEHFEMWGRKIELVFVDGTGEDEVAQRADAVRVATDIKPFMATTASTPLEIYSQELAARGVIVWDHNVSWKASQQQAGFRWGSQIDDRTVITHVAEYVGKRLKGRPAKWAGDATLNGKPRVFGLVYPDVWDKETFDAEAGKYGLQMADAISYVQGDTVGAQERARVLVSRLKAKGVTSVVAATDYLFTVVLTKEATNQLYRPEWVMTGWNYQDVVLFARLFDQQQWAHAFGIGPVQTLTKPENFETVAVHTWHHGRKPSDGGHNGNSWVSAYLMYPCLQLAGPTLTPETFRQGCFSYQPSGGSYCGCKLTIGASFGRHSGSAWDDYTGWDDMTEKWWDPNASGGDEAGITPTGGYYWKVDGGARYTAGKWPTSEPRAFENGGAVTFHDDYTPEERPPDYEHRSH